ALIDVQDLELPADAFSCDRMARQPRDRLSHEVDLACRWRLLAGDEIEERRFAGAVRTHEAAQLTRIDAQVKVVGRGETAEALDQGLRLQDRDIVDAPRLSTPGRESGAHRSVCDRGLQGARVVERGV